MADRARRDPDELLTPTDLRQYLGMSASTFRRHRDAGELLEPTIMIGDSPRWRWADVREWVRRGGHRPPPPPPKKNA